jgi:N-acyl-D-aspartate/D-glutamate deacylase
VLARLRAPATREVVRAYWDEGQNYLLRAGGPEGIVVTYAPHSPDVVGLNFVQIAARRQVTMADAACDILLAEGDNLYNALITHVFATRPHLDELISQPNCAIMSDGVASAPYGPLAGLRTTRDSYGYTAAFLQEYVRQRKIFSLEEAIRRMTSLPATLCDISDRGRLAEHAAADIVVFDLAEIRDVTTDLDLIGHPEGIEWVIVNGEIVVARREHTGRLPGSLL